MCIFSCLQTVYEPTMQDRKEKCNKSTQYFFHREHELNSYTDYSLKTPCGRNEIKMFTLLNTVEHNTD